MLGTWVSFSLFLVYVGRDGLGMLSGLVWLFSFTWLTFGIAGGLHPAIWAGQTGKKVSGGFEAPVGKRAVFFVIDKHHVRYPGSDGHHDWSSSVHCWR